jgi:hypothetical protein
VLLGVDYDLDGDDEDFVSKINSKKTGKLVSHLPFIATFSSPPHPSKSDALFSTAQQININQFEKMIEELERECFIAEQRLSLQRDEQRIQAKAQRTKDSVEALLEKANSICQNIKGAVGDEEDGPSSDVASGNGEMEKGEGSEEDAASAVPVSEKVPLEKAKRLLRYCKYIPMPYTGMMVMSFLLCSQVMQQAALNGAAGAGAGGGSSRSAGSATSKTTPKAKKKAREAGYERQVVFFRICCPRPYVLLSIPWHFSYPGVPILGAEADEDGNAAPALLPDFPFDWQLAARWHGPYYQRGIVVGWRERYQNI